MTEIETLTARAEQGDLEAQYALAHAYHLGWVGVARDLARARHWYQTASSRGHAASALQMGLIHLNELAAPDREGAQAWFERSTALGNQEAAYQLGRLLADSDLAASLDWYVKAARAGYGPALYQLGLLAQEGRGGVRRNPDKACDCFRRGYEAGHAPSAYAYARCLLDGSGVAADRRAAQRVLGMAADQGHAPAATLAGLLHLEDGEAGSALARFEQAALREDPEALYQLGRLHEDGSAGVADALAALMAYRRAAERGQRQAMLRLAELLAAGPLGQAPDAAGAAYWQAQARA